MKVINSLFLFANLSASVSDMLVKYFLITVKSRDCGLSETGVLGGRFGSIRASQVAGMEQEIPQAR